MKICNFVVFIDRLRRPLEVKACSMGMRGRETRQIRRQTLVRVKFSHVKLVTVQHFSETTAFDSLCPLVRYIIRNPQDLCDNRLIA